MTWSFKTFQVNQRSTNSRLVTTGKLASIQTIKQLVKMSTWIISIHTMAPLNFVARIDLIHQRWNKTLKIVCLHSIHNLKNHWLRMEIWFQINVFRRRIYHNCPTFQRFHNLKIHQLASPKPRNRQGIQKHPKLQYPKINSQGTRPAITKNLPPQSLAPMWA